MRFGKLTVCVVQCVNDLGRTLLTLSDTDKSLAVSAPDCVGADVGVARVVVEAC